MSRKAIDLSGRVFSKLTVLKERLPRTKPRMWYCQCECGKTKLIAHSNLTSGSTKSCGCSKNELISKASTTHGGRFTPLYNVFSSMHTRCSNPNSPSYPHYGGKGIQVCKEWANFQPFQDWAKSSGYAQGLTIDRIDSSKHYSPENCRWVSYVIQNRNRSKQKNSSSKYIGVSWNSRKQKWKADIKVNDLRIFLGYFDCETEAAKTRDQYIIDNSLQGFVLNF